MVDFELFDMDCFREMEYILKGTISSWEDFDGIQEEH